MKTRTYLHFNEGDFDHNANKIIYVTTLLKGDTLALFEPTPRNYLNDDKEKNRETKFNRILLIICGISHVMGPLLFVYKL